MEKFFAFFDYLHNVFYGDHWFIFVAILLYIPDFLKSLKASKARNSKK